MGKYLLGVWTFLTLAAGVSHGDTEKPKYILGLGAGHTCLVPANGDLICWGSAGQYSLPLAASTKLKSPTVIRADQMNPVIGLSTFYRTSCVIFANRRIKCWGNNFYGQLGYESPKRGIGNDTGETVDELPYVDLGADGAGQPWRVSSMAIGENTVCAVIERGRLKCWGKNDRGMLGLGHNREIGGHVGDMGNGLPFVDLGKDAFVEKVAVGGLHVCALLRGGSVKCWGGQPGTGDQSHLQIGAKPGEMGDRLKAIGNGEIEDLATGYYTTCALLKSQEVKCWGLNEEGALGLGDPADLRQHWVMPPYSLSKLSPVLLGSLAATSLSCGNISCCAVMENGALKCWGYNGQGQLGLGDAVSRGYLLDDMGDNLPHPDLGKLAEVRQVAVGAHTTCAELATGQLKCWGYGEAYQLGNGTTQSLGAKPTDMGDALKPIPIP